MSDAEYLARLDERIAEYDRLIDGQRERIQTLEGAGMNSGPARQLLAVLTSARLQLQYERAELLARRRT